MYNEAKKYAKKVNKKLLVIGNPNAGFWNRNIMKAYDCGNICLDLQGCDCPQFIKGDILEELRKISDNKYVIFESCVLEYTNQKLLDKTKKEINRVSGGDYFEVRISPCIIPLNYSLFEKGLISF
jgi:hypothetical protein